MRIATILMGAMLAGTAAQAAETCTTQSQMQPAEREGLEAAARALALKVQANDQPGVRALTIAEYQTNFAGMGGLIAATSPRLAGATPQVDQLYILDASKADQAGAAAEDASFYCPLNKSQAEVDFAIPQLPAGRYAFATVWMDAAKPWLLSFLMRSANGSWQLAGLYPKPLTAAGHDSLWYWTQGRVLAADKQPWNAWLYLQEAQALGQPAGFVSSTHLEKLQAEVVTDAPPALSGGIGTETPLVVKGADGTEYRFTSLALTDTFSADKADVEAHIKVDVLGDAAVARKRNMDAMTALVDAHPELRKAFHGVSLFADPADGAPYGIELAMADIH